MTTVPAPILFLFRKKPVVVAAVQWFKNGDHPKDYSKTHDGLENGELRKFAPEERRANGWEGDIVRYYRRPDDSGERACQHCGKTMHFHGWIDTLEGGHIVCPGDWIITGVEGEHYPCKPGIFVETYEPVDRIPADSLPIEPVAVAVVRDGKATFQWQPSFRAMPKGRHDLYLRPRIPADATQARTGNTQAEQDVWFEGVEEGQRRTEHNAAVRSAWMPIESAPKDGTEILAWREDCGQFISSYTSADAFPMTQDELDAWDEETLFAKDWFTQWPQAIRLDGSEVPTLWRPMLADPCQTCNDQGAVGNILTAEPCPDCTPAASAQDDAKDELQGQPLKLVHLAVAEDGGVRFMTGRGLPDGIESCELYAMPDYGRAPAELYTAPPADDAPPRFTISASDRFELTGAVGLLRGYGCGGAADALQRTLDAEMASFSVQGEDAAGDARECDPLQGAANWLVQAHGRPSPTVLCRCLMIGYNRAQRLYDAAIAAQQGKGGAV